MGTCDEHKSPTGNGSYRQESASSLGNEPDRMPTVGASVYSMSGAHAVEPGQITVVNRTLPSTQHKTTQHRMHTTKPHSSQHEPRTTQNSTWTGRSAGLHMRRDSRSHYLQSLLSGERSAGNARGCGARQGKAAHEAKGDEGGRTAGTMT